jgi:hypothetical protein
MPDHAHGGMIPARSRVSWSLRESRLNPARIAQQRRNPAPCHRSVTHPDYIGVVLQAYLHDNDKVQL